MSNFMGPMAPPPAAPAQPQALDFQTDPNQRQRFKQFMQQRMQPPMPQMPAPMPQPMPTVPAGSYILPDIDIFAPQQFYDGGIVGGLNNLGEMSGQMVEALNQVVYGGDPMGGGMPSAPSGPPSMGGGGFGGGNMPPPLPPVDTSVYQPGGSTDSSGPVANIGSGVPTALPYNHVGASIPSPNVSDGMYISNFVDPPRGMEGQPGYGNIAQPNFMQGAFNYFGETYDTFNPDTGLTSTAMTPELMVQQAQGRLMQMDVKPPEVDAYLQHIIKTGGRPTMMAPKQDFSNLVGVLPGGGLITGQPGPGFGLADEGGPIDPYRNPYSMPGFTPLPPGELGFTEDMMGPIEAYMGGSKYFDESTGLYTGPDLNQDPLYKFADGGSVPPRETSIRGQYHELSYITPDEADILMALGGSGEPGPMGIPQYSYGDGDFGQDDPDSDATAGAGPSGGRDDNNDYRGYQEEDEQQQTKDMQDYEENVFGGDSPDGYSVQDILNANAGISETLGDVYDMNAINRGRQDRMNLQETLDNTLENEIETGKVSTGTAVNDGDIESLDALTNAVESSSKIGGTNTGNNLLGGIDDLLGSLDKAISKVSGPTQSEIQAGTFTPTVVGSSDPETEDLDLDQATIDALAKDFYGNAGVDQSVIDKISRGSSQSGLESEGILGSLGIGSGAAYKGSVNNRFGTATGPGRLSTVTAKEMEALRTGNAVQRQMYRQLAGIKSAGPVLSSFDPNNVKDPNILDSIFGVTNKPSSAIEVFRAPITEQQGFKSVNTGTFKDGIAGVTGEGNTPGVIGGIMQMFGIDPIVYTGDNRFDPNREEDIFGGGGDDNILLPLKPEEVAPESTDPNQIGGINTPADPLAPAGPVLVPSTRTSTPFSGQMPVGYGSPQTGQINPYALSEMKRYEQLLRQLGQAKSPIGLAQGGSVLDAAAGRFLESLTAA
jgi:hypothetical protein